MLNLPLLIGTLAAIAVLVPAVYFWHAFQLQRTSQVFLAEAKRLEEVGELHSAADQLHRYLSINPADDAARTRLAIVYDRSAETLQDKTRSIELLYRALGVSTTSADGSNATIDLRLRIAERLLELNRFAEAEKQAKQAMQSAADAAATRLLALALYGSSLADTLGERDAEVVADEVGFADHLSQQPVGDVVEIALQSNPGDVKLSTALAYICRSKPNWFSPPSDDGAALLNKAQTAIDDMLDAHPHDPEALLGSFWYHRDLDLARAERDLAAAVEHAGQNSNVLLTAAAFRQEQADQAQQDGRLEEARTWREAAAADYRRLLDEFGLRGEEIYSRLGQVLLANDKADEAITVWESGLQALGENPLLRARLADALISLERLDEAERHIDGLDNSLRSLTSNNSLEARRRFMLAANVSRARLYVQRKNDIGAVPWLELATANPTGRMDPALWQLAGVAFSELGQWDRAAHSFEQASILAPSPQRRLQAGVAWLRAGNPEQAIEFFRDSADTSFEAKIAYVEARLFQQAAPTARQREAVLAHLNQELEALAAAVAKLETEPPRVWRLALLRADVALAQDDAANMAEVLSRLCELQLQHTDDVEFLAALTPRLERLGAPNDADLALSSLEACDADRAVLAGANLYRLRGDIEGAKKLLSDRLNSNPAAARQFQQAFLSLLIGEGRFEDALEMLTKLDPADYGFAQLGAEISLMLAPARERSASTQQFRGQLTKWSEDVKGWEDKLKKLEGPEGTYWRYCRARRLAALATSPKDPVLEEAEAIQQQLAGRRPDWFSTHLVRGMIAERQGQLDDAAAAYEAALRFDRTSSFAYERLAYVLYLSGRFAESNALLDRMGNHISASQNLSAIALASAARLNHLDNAVAIAESGVETRPSDPMAWTWLGQVTTLAALAEEEDRNVQYQKAEDAFRRAITVSGGTDSRAWLALFGFLIRIDDKPRATEVFDQLKQVVALPDPVQKGLVLGQACEALEDWKQAELHYRDAARQQADDDRAGKNLASYYLRRKDLAAAEGVLRQLHKNDPNAKPIRQMLAVVLSNQGGERAWDEVRELLASDGSEDAVPTDRLQAVLISGRGRPEDLEEARQLLERIVRDPVQVTPGDRMLLAWIYARLAKSILDVEDEERAVERGGFLAAAREQYEYLVYQNPPDPSHLAAAIEFHLAEVDLTEAGRQMATLKRLEPTSSRTLSLEVRLLHAQDKTEQLNALLQTWVNEQTNEAERVHARLASGRMLHSFGLYDDAAAWFREVLETDSSAFPALAMSLAAQGDAQRHEAVVLCLAAADGDAKKQVSALAAVFAAGPISSADSAACEPILSQALDQYGDDPQVLMALANIRLVQGDVDQAERLYRQVLATRPADAVVLNNLAAILAEKKAHGSEAEQLINRAIEKSGELPYLLDTKGIVLLSRGRAEEAVDLLERAAALDSDPRHLFHYTAALWKAQDRARARKIWQRLDMAALRRQLLTSSDQQLLLELSRNLDG